MACYLKIEFEETECAACGRTTPPCAVGYTDEIQPPKLVPVCERCLDGLDRHLANIQQLLWVAGAILPRLLGRAPWNPPQGGPIMPN